MLWCYFRALLGPFFISFGLIIVSCKTRNRENDDIKSELVNSKPLSTQYVVRSRMIFKFYCRESQKVPECEEFEVMHVENFLDAAGLKWKDIEDFKVYSSFKKAHDLAQMKLEKLENAYQEAIARKGDVLNSQKLEYQRMKKFYQKEIKNFSDFIPTEQVRKAKEMLQNTNDLEKYFEADVGEVVASSIFTCAKNVLGKLFCWGNDESNNVTGWKQYVNSGELKFPLRQITFGMIAIGADGKLVSWGDGNQGLSFKWNRLLDEGPLKDRFKYFAFASRDFQCASDVEGKAVCLDGSNHDETISLKKLIESGEYKLPIRKIEAAQNFACALDGVGFLLCWRSNLLGRRYLSRDDLGISKFISKDIKTPIKKIELGDRHACAVGADGKMKCWGSDDKMQVSGLDEAIKSGRLIEPVQNIFLGRDATCAQGKDNSFSCWGEYADSMIEGLNKKISEGKLKYPIVKFVPNNYVNCAIDAGRNLECWGDNRFGAVDGLNEAGYKIGEFTPEDFVTDLTQLGYYED